MAATTGTVSINFGALGSASTEQVTTITGQASIITGSQCDAWLRGETNSDHEVEELMAEEFDVTCNNIVAGTGFDISVRCRHGSTTGTWIFTWVWV